MLPELKLKLVAAVRLSLGAAESRPPLAAVGWLRGLTFAMPPEITPEQASNACFLAEKDFFAREDAWLRMRPAPVEGGDLRGVLRRLGLTAVDACYVLWLASLIVARARPHVRFSDDGPDALDRVYHEHSKYVAAVLDDQRPAASEIAPTAADPGDGVALPAPSTEGVEALARLLGERRSHRTGYRGSFTLDQLAQLLGLSLGRATPITVEVRGQRFQLGRLTYPSAGARYPLRAHVIARRVDGLEPGSYVYELDHRLRRVTPAPTVATVLRAAPVLDGAPGDAIAVQAADAPVLLVVVADLGTQREHYGLRSYRLVHLECGHLAQNLCLVATALGMPCITIASFHDDLVNQMLGLDGVNRAALYMLPFGAPT